MKSYRLLLQPFRQVRAQKFGKNTLGAADRVYAAVYDAAGRMWLGTEKGVLFSADGLRFTKLFGVETAVQTLFALPDGTLLAGCGANIYRIKDEKLAPVQTLKEAILAFAGIPGMLFALTKTALYCRQAEEFVHAQDIDFGTGRCMGVTPAGVAYIACDETLYRLFGKRPRFGNMLPGMTNTPKTGLNCIVPDALGQLWCGTDAGVYVFDGRSEWVPPAELSGFPACRVTALVLGKRDIYVGTEQGLYIISGEHTRFYGSGRYLPGSRVHAIAVSPDENEVWVGTDGGAAKLSFASMTLSEKAQRFEDQIPFFTREGYVTDRSGVKNGDLTTGRIHITDNDGLYTAEYVAYQCMRYALTGEKAALTAARGSMRALLKLQRVTGIPGFPARAYRRPGEHRFGDGDPEWHLTQDETGPLEWKGETSSDELTGHYFAACWYYDLCADAAEKADIAEATRAMTDHILSHNYTLCDTDGLPTTWAHFGPEELNHDNCWCWEKGVNSLELISFLTVTYHMTQDEVYLREKKKLLEEHHYAMNVLAYKKDDAHTCHIDDRLTSYAAAHLLRLETDEAVLRCVRLGLRRHFEYIREEYYPFHVFLFNFANGAHKDLDEAVRVLEEFPLDGESHRIRNSVRADVRWEERVALFGEEAHLKDALPAGERVTGALHSNAREADGGNPGRVYSPCTWLVSYWFGRYLGYISE